MGPDGANREARLERAAALLAECRRTGTAIDQLPEDCRPESEAEGYQLQQRVSRLLQVEPDCWKVSAQGPNGATAAPVYRPSPLRAPAASDSFMLIEAEIALRLDRDLRCGSEERYGRETIIEAMAEFAVAFELVTYRLTAADLPIEQRLADCFANDGAVIGTSLPMSALTERPVERLELFRDGQLIPFTPVDIDPIGSVMAYANRGGDCLGGLKAGQWILTGSLVGMFPVRAPSEWSARWGGKSDVLLRIG